MAALSWILAGAWVVAILVSIHDLVDWQMRPEDVRERQRRTPVVLLICLTMTGLALWTVLFPYLTQVHE